MPFYEKEWGEINKMIKDKLLAVSSATLDRILKDEKRRLNYKILRKKEGKKKDKVSKLIPIKTHLEWEFNKYQPGYLQIDLVSHDGGSLGGDFIQSLNMVDYKTGWSITIACLNKAALNVFPQLDKGLLLFPFEIKAIHSDSGKEFINDHLYRYCKEKNIVFTRSRPYKKDDNFWIENRNDKKVRKNVGYLRYQGKDDLILLNSLYDKLNLYENFFKPQRRCIKKERIKARIRKIYDSAQTPYQRALKEKTVLKENKIKLKRMYNTLNPIKLRKEIIRLQEILLKDEKTRKDFVLKLGAEQ